MRRVLVFLMAVLLGATALRAETAETASLVADSLSIRSGSVLVAEGHVEMFYKGAHLVAARLTYDRANDRLQLDGPIWIDDGRGNVLQAEMADLSADLTEGLIRSARLVLAEKMQLAAGEILRTGQGRYEAMRSVAASSCRICKGQTTPLWEIRAQRVVHDTVAQQIWFSGAQLRFGGVPVMYLPELRVPDPNLKRASGFLLPVMTSTTRLGTGLKLPYFLVLGDSRDLTVTPYLTTNGDQTVALRYRQAFRTGQITLTGAVSDDDLVGPDLRGYLQADGGFALPHGYKLDFHLIDVSDPAYLSDYRISGEDRLYSTIDLTRTTRNSWFSAGLTGIHSLRPDEGDGTTPSLLTDFTLARRFEPAILGGTGGFEAEIHTTTRPSSDALDTNGDGQADGRDLGRVSLRFDWRRNWMLGQGIELSAIGLLAADSYHIAQDADFAGTAMRVAGTAGVELRWPWTRVGPAMTQTIEPVVQLILAPQTRARIPNEDSALVEFDEGNLFGLDRFPGADAVEGGLRANLGLNYDAIFTDGLDLGVTLGRVVRVDTPLGFPAASGLADRASDWLLAWNLSDGSDQGLQLTNRLVISDGGGLTKGELRLDLNRPRFDLAGGYSYVQADAQEDRPDPISEVVFDGSYDLTGQWTVNGTGRYNVDASRMAQAGIALSFRNECLSVDLSLSRRYASSTSVKPSTDFGLSVELLGFGGSGAVGAARQCRQ